MPSGTTVEIFLVISFMLHRLFYDKVAGFGDVVKNNPEAVGTILGGVGGAGIGLTRSRRKGHGIGRTIGNTLLGAGVGAGVGYGTGSLFKSKSPVPYKRSIEEENAMRAVNGLPAIKDWSDLTKPKFGIGIGGSQSQSPCTKMRLRPSLSPNCGKSIDEQLGRSPEQIRLNQVKRLKAEIADVAEEDGRSSHDQNYNAHTYNYMSGGMLPTWVESVASGGDLAALGASTRINPFVAARGAIGRAIGGPVAIGSIPPALFDATVYANDGMATKARNAAEDKFEHMYGKAVNTYAKGPWGQAWDHLTVPRDSAISNSLVNNLPIEMTRKFYDDVDRVRQGGVYMSDEAKERLRQDVNSITDTKSALPVLTRLLRSGVKPAEIQRLVRECRSAKVST